MHLTIFEQINAALASMGDLF